MRISRVFLDRPLAVGDQVEIDTQAHHRLVNVLKYRPGTRLIIFNGQGGEFTATLQHVFRSSSLIEVDKFIDCHRESNLKTNLIQGIARGDRMDFTLQKTVELGINLIQPIFTANSSVSANKRHLENKHRHWARIITTACEQCGRTLVPKLLRPITLTDYLDSNANRFGIVLDPKSHVGLKTLSFNADEISILIGPEGGLSNQELKKTQENGFSRIGLGPRVLRTETAAVTTLAVAQSLWGDLK
ncbi:MAG: 16S rRNA (uracil(1498)-N(3))-methyltransferase [Gammaproteobacteria bacterium]|nr:16S rRNA (uracil(1498)-N(3))-methyltransferase [Gammaproteobacteria bacterium]